MPFANYADYLKALGYSPFSNVLTMSTRPLNSTCQDDWLSASGGTPTTPVVPTSATTGAIPFTNAVSGTNKISNVYFNSGANGFFILADRLSHQSGLSSTVAGTQTTNLPTAALTRYTSGEGVQIGLSIYTAVGSTATTFTVSYTNSQGVSGRTSPATQIGGSGYRETRRFLRVPLQQGDTGVRSVESFNLTSTTGTLGNPGITLYKPLLAIKADYPLVQDCNLLMSNMAGGFPEIVNDACLFVVGSISNSFANVQMLFNFVDN